MTEIEGLPVGYAEYLGDVQRDVLATQQPARRVLNSAVLILAQSLLLWRLLGLSAKNLTGTEAVGE